AEWTKRYQMHPAYQKYVAEPLTRRGYSLDDAGRAAPQTQPAEKRPRPRQVSSLRQFFILSARNINILVRDRFSLVLMLAVAPVVGLLDLVLSALLGRNP